MLCVADEELRARTTAVVAELGDDVELLGVAETGTDLLVAVDNADDLDVVLIDDRVGPLPYLNLIREVVARAPDVAVLVMSSRPTTQLFQDAMEAGARAILDAPPSHDELADRLPRILEWQRHVRSMSGQALPMGTDGAGRLVAFTGAKGGVGTSTLALHTAILAAVSNPERRVCLIDLDVQHRGIRQLLDLTARRSIIDLVTVADSLTGRNLDEATVVHKSGLHVLMAPEQGEQAEELDGASARHIVAAAKGHYDLVVVDAGSVVTEASAVAMEFADRLLMVVTPDVPCVRAAQDKVELLGRLQVAKSDDLALLFNKVSSRTEVQPDFAARMVEADALPVSVPDDFKRLEAVSNALAPLDLEDGPFRRALLALGRELRMALPAREAEQPAKPQRGRGRRRRESGQVTIEAVVGITVAMMIFLVLLQVTMIAVAMFTSGRAADAAARVAERDGGTMQKARQAAESVTPPFLDVEVTRVGMGDTYRAKVTPPELLPFFHQTFSADRTAAEG